MVVEVGLRPWPAYIIRTVKFSEGGIMDYINVPGRVMAVVTMLALQGCGHKGPLMLPAPEVQKAGAQTSQAQTSGTQPTSPQGSDLPATGQNPSPQ
jgi:predicted small lipoprotein YifL